MNIRNAVRRPVLRALVSVLALAGLAGCAVGNTHAYTTAAPVLKMQSQLSTAVGVQDQRPYVLNHDKDEDFVGVQRAGFGNPFDVTTESKKPIAVDFSGVITTALQKRGMKAETIVLAPSADPADGKKKLIAASKDRLLLLELIEWKSDTYNDTGLLYHVRLSVFDHGGALLGEVTKQGDEDLGGSFMNPPAHAKSAVPVALQRILEELLNDPRIVGAFQPSA